jgi:conjugative transfer signal peptidase TraF
MIQARAPLLATILGIAAIGFSAVGHGSLALLLYNPSTSAPRGLYWRDPVGTYRVGHYAFAHMPPGIAALASRRGYLPGDVWLLKPIAALAGDIVCVRFGFTFINGHPAARLLVRDADGRQLQPWAGCRALEVDEVFLLSQDSAASFDGRYFGPVHYSDLRGVATPLWTW